MRVRYISSIALAAALVSCASTDLGQRQVNHKVVDKASIEAGYDFESNKIENKLKRSGAIIKDAALNSYLKDITSTIAGDYDGQLEIYALEAPVFNAGIFPNGAMFIYSGLLLRVESEAELALVLGHEFGHFVERHALERRVATDNAIKANLLFSVGTLGYGTLFSTIAAASQLTEFSREQEVEADKIGLERLSKEGFHPSSAIELWENLDNERAQSTNEKVRKRNRRSAIFSTHPTSSERLEKLKIHASTLTGDRIAKDEYRARIRPFLQPWLAAELSQRDYGSIFHLIDRLSKSSEDLGVLNYMRGQTYATRNKDGDNLAAISAYREATKYDDVPSYTWRALGDLHSENEDFSQAKKAFQKYLSEAPDAEDQAMVRYMIDNMGK